MPAPRTGAISLDDIHVAAGGTSGTSCSINDLDIKTMLNRQEHQTITQSFDDYYGASSQFYFVSGDETVTANSDMFDTQVGIEDATGSPVAAYTQIDITFGSKEMTYSIKDIVEHPSGNDHVVTGTHVTEIHTTNAGPDRADSDGSKFPGNDSAQTGTIRYGGIGDVTRVVPYWIGTNLDVDTDNNGVARIFATYANTQTDAPRFTRTWVDTNTSTDPFTQSDLSTNGTQMVHTSQDADFTPNVMLTPSEISTDGKGSANTHRFKIMAFSDGNSTTQNEAKLNMSSSGDKITLNFQFVRASSSPLTCTFQSATASSGSPKLLRAISFKE